MLSMPAPLFARAFSPRRRTTRHTVLFGFGVLALLFLLAGCDYHDDDRDPRYPVGNPDNGVRSFTFSLCDTDNRGDCRFGLTFSADSVEVQYDTDDEFYPQLASLLTPNAVDEGVVLLYVSDVVDANGLRRNGWTALPLTLGYDLEGNADGSPDGFIDYTLTTTYTYDVRRLWVNLVASDVFTLGFLDRTEGLLAKLDRLDFRLVTIPGGNFNKGLDYSNYEAVKQAYGLPD